MFRNLFFEKLIPDKNPCDYSNIPGSLKDMKRWVVALDTKVPFNVSSGKPASVVDPTTWTTFDKSVSYLCENYNKKFSYGVSKDGRLSNLGFVFSDKDGFVGIDIDHCLDENGDSLSTVVTELIGMTDSYVEKSRSGKGIHIIVKGTMNYNIHRVKIDDNIELEIYNNNRYFCLTGDCVKANEVTDGQALIDYIENKYSSKKVASKVPNGDGSAIIDTVEVPEEIKQILQSAMQKDLKLRRQYNGDRILGNESADDMSLLCKLAPLSNNDPETLKALFLESEHVKSKDSEHLAKLNRADYLDNSIYKALNFVCANNEDVCANDLDLLDLDLTDSGNANRFIHAYGNVAKYSSKEDRWYVYSDNNGIWNMDSKKNTKVKGLATELYQRIMHACDSIDSKDYQKNFKRLGNESCKNNMLNAAQCLSDIEPDEFDNHTDLLTVKNGVINLRTGELLDFNPNYKLTQCVKVDYNPEAAKPTRFLKFLNEIFANNTELVNYVLRVLGYAITGEVGESKFFIAHGSGANGKSLLFNLMNYLFGNYGSNISRSTFMQKRNEDGPNPGIMKVRKNRLVIANELHKEDKLDTALVKALTGGKGETICARELYGASQEFMIQFKLFFVTNYLPSFDWFDQAILRRAVLIPFHVTIPPEKQDFELLDKLKEESEGILALLVKEAGNYYKYGLGNTPEAVKAALEDVITLECPLKAFMNEKVTVTHDFNDRVQASEFYVNLKDWCIEHGIESCDIPTLTYVGNTIARMSGIRRIKEKSSKHTFYLGMKLNNNDVEDFQVDDHLEDSQIDDYLYDDPDIY